MGPSNPDLERIESEVGPGFLPNFVPPPKWKKQTDECECWIKRWFNIAILIVVVEAL